VQSTAVMGFLGIKKVQNSAVMGFLEKHTQLFILRKFMVKPYLKHNRYNIFAS
jgi:hypothetical protein